MLLTKTSTITAALTAALTFTACSSGVGNSSPRVTAVPAQSTTGGTAFSLDLAPYVNDREGQALTYSVVSGGGSFSDSTYSNTFDTMGTYTVTFQVNDADKVTESQFTVTVTTARFAVVKEDDAGVLLLDTDTEQFVRVAANADSPRLAATLEDGKVLYNVGPVATQKLWVFDPLTRQPLQLGSGHAGAATYRTVTTDGVVMFTCGDNTDQDLYAYDSTTGLVRAVAATAGEMEQNPVANGQGLVFFERGNGGQADIFYYDPSENETVAVSTDAAGETIRGVLADGGVVFSRLVSGFNELFYFKVGTGLTQIPTLATASTANKVFATSTTSSDVVYTYLDSGAGGTSVGWWNPDGSQGSTTSANTMTVFGATANREVVVLDTVSGTDRDLYVINVGTAATAFTLDTADLVTALAVGTDGTNSYVVYQDTTTTNLHIRNVTGAATSTVSDAAGITYLTTLDNGDVVFQKSDQTNVALFDVSAAATTLDDAGTGMTYAGPGPEVGDVVYTAEVGGQTDILLWDASAAATVVVSNDGADDVFGRTTTGGEVLFTREDTGGFQQLRIFDPADLTTETLTGEDTAGMNHDHTVLGVYQAQ